MTTVFGLKHPEVEATVLVADRQTTSINPETKAPTGKLLGRKLWVSKDGNFCFGHAGNRDEQTLEFVDKLVSGKYDIEKIVSKGYFPELRKLNIKRVGNKFSDPQNFSGIIIATRFGNIPSLYTCFPFGEVGKRVWTCAGSGDEKIEEYMNALRILTEAKDYLGNHSKTGIEDVIRVGLEAVRRSQGQDLFSHGLDMMVCTSERINDHYEDLGDDFGKKLQKLQKRYRETPKTE